MRLRRFGETIREPDMAHSQDTKKEKKKPAQKTAKEKKQAKQEKKGGSKSG